MGSLGSDLTTELGAVVSLAGRCGRWPDGTQELRRACRRPEREFLGGGGRGRSSWQAGQASPTRAGTEGRCPQALAPTGGSCTPGYRIHI